jgi:DNA-binding transcriptional ArsR family regulator/anti-sigma regulatory factor (Ser/Thr protein kinase)
MRTPSSRVRIAALLEGGKALSAAEIARRLKVTRPVVTRHLSALVKEGGVVREGQGRRLRYRAWVVPSPAAVAAAADAPPPASPVSFVRRYPRAVLSEGRVWQELLVLHPALGRLPAPARELFQYAFTEMLNNAIEHSQGTEVEVRFAQASDDTLSFEVIDDGVGLFHNLRALLGLASAEEAARKLSQARLPPWPDGRAGAGLFFSSRAARRFEVESNGFRWLVDNPTGQTVAASAPPRTGTRVRFQGDLQPRRPLAELFARYNEHTIIHRTRVVVTLGTGFISRSEAQRLLAPLERYHTVVLDFRGVEEIGQGFADEVFRIWPTNHPHVTLEPINMSPGVSLMVDHARRLR